MTKKPKAIDTYPIGMVGGAAEFEELYPEEMMRLGALTAYWALVEEALCLVLTMLLGSRPKAEAAFYSTTNHKARRDMVLAVAKNSALSEIAMHFITSAIEATGEAADQRNSLLHSLFKVQPLSGELLSINRRPATKKPEIIRNDIMEEIDRAINKCEIAANLLQSGAMAVKWPNYPDDLVEIVNKHLAEKRKSLPLKPT